jgi:hypothetical protein
VNVDIQQNKNDDNSAESKKIKTSGSNRKSKKLIIVVVSVISLVCIGIYLFFASLFAGGVDGYVYNLKPQPSPENPKINTRRNQIKKDIESEFFQIEKYSNLKYYGTSVYDNCYEGDNNWKVKEGFAHRCDYRVTKFYGFNEDFRFKILSYENEITALGWSTTRPEDLGLRGIVTDYYDPHHSEKNSQLNVQDFGRDYLVSDLPDDTNFDKDGMSMEVAFAERKTEDLSDLKRIQGYSSIGSGIPFYEEKDFADIQITFSNITKDNTYVLAVSLNKNYFDN